MDHELLQVLRESAIANVRVSNQYKKMDREYYNGNRYFTYALLLQNNKIYVGDTSNIYSRLMSHFEMSESSAKWVKLHGPVKRVLEITYDAPPGAENERTLEYADIFGYENVRGGYHCKLNMETPPSRLDDFKRGQMKHKFLQRDEIRQIELDIRAIVAEKIDNTFTQE
ncbi:GIY-YIG catalytic domain-containing endonuclease [Paramecium bursaria Chlorella virus KS1B]|nr:GIY-YIG catalytic domain-containing endonuclease [Paramecium bursaria Chlorella virus KS1B]